MNYKSLFIIFITGLAILNACRDTEEITSSPEARLNFSTDTIQFDTIFTTIGSITKHFKVYNRNTEGVKTTITLANNSSNYRLNIDGQPTNSTQDFEIRGNDSIYIFVEVTVDPQNSNSPMIVEDEVICYTNGNKQSVKLVAYGQDVHLFDGEVLKSQTWEADKPYLIYNSVLVDSAETLTIKEGAQIHFHNQSALWIVGSLNVQGTIEEPVVFQGDRLDDYYDDLPGQWWGRYTNDSLEIDYLTGCIHFWQGSTNNVIDHAVIKNGTKGIQVDIAPNENPNLIIKNSIIQNMSSIGLLAQSANIVAINSVISNCGHYAAVFSLGGSYEFYHSTIANYYSFDTRDNEALAFNNYYYHNNEYVTFDFNAYFYNSIIYGSLENEFIIDQHIDANKTFAFTFDHCLMKLNDKFDSSNEQAYINIIRDNKQTPNFVDAVLNDFRLDTLSAAKDAGSIQYIETDILRYDLEGNDRLLDGKPDLGAFERIENSEN